MMALQFWLKDLKYWKLLNEEKDPDNQLDTLSKGVQQFSNQYKELYHQIHNLTFKSQPASHIQQQTPCSSRRY